jgi:hypothetical protein
MQAFYAQYRYAECSYAECHYGECRGPLNRRSTHKYEFRGEPLWFSGRDRVK